MGFSCPNGLNTTGLYRHIKRGDDKNLVRSYREIRLLSLDDALAWKGNVCKRSTENYCPVYRNLRYTVSSFTITYVSGVRL